MATSPGSSEAQEVVLEVPVPRKLMKGKSRNKSLLITRTRLLLKPPEELQPMQYFFAEVFGIRFVPTWLEERHPVMNADRAELRP